MLKLDFKFYFLVFIVTYNDVTKIKTYVCTEYFFLSNESDIKFELICLCFYFPDAKLLKGCKKTHVSLALLLLSYCILDSVISEF